METPTVLCSTVAEPGFDEAAAWEAPWEQAASEASATSVAAIRASALFNRFLLAVTDL